MKNVGDLGGMRKKKRRQASVGSVGADRGYENSKGAERVHKASRA